MVKSFITLILFTFSLTLTAQHTFSELKVPVTPVGIQCVPLHDSLFLTYRMPFPPKGTNEFQTVMLSHNASQRELDISELKGAVLCGAAHYDDGDYNYYFSHDKGDMQIKALVTHSSNHQRSVSDQSVIVPGELLGSDVSNEQLIVYTFQEKTFSLKVTKIHKLQVAESFDYALSFDLSKYKKSGVAFIPERIIAGAMQACARVKLFTQGDNVTLILDEPYNEYAEDQPEFYRTTVIRMNIVTHEKSLSPLYEKTKGNFRSFLYKDQLFRVVNSLHKFTLQVFDVVSGKSLYTKTITRDKDNDPKRVIVKEKKTYSYESLTAMMKSIGSFTPYVLVNENTDHRDIITVGTYRNRENGAISFLTAGNVLGFSPLFRIVPLTAGSTTRQMLNGESLRKYFYLEGDTEKGFDFSETSNIPTLPQKIDAYEMQLQKEKANYYSKGYQEFNGGILAFYHLPSQKKIQIVEFKK
jgi:hypothetical protein